MTGPSVFASAPEHRAARRPVRRDIFGSFEAPPPDSVVAGRRVIRHLPLLSRHAGTAPDLLMSWNAMTTPAAVDVVVHLHGWSGRGRAMRIDRDKAPLSGLDLADPTDPTRTGRRTPTLLLLPRGHFFGGRSGAGYTFPALQAAGALRRLVDEGLAGLAEATGLRRRAGRLVLTAHSGGGASLMAILRHTDPDEVHAFDALYGDPGPLIAWARGRIERGDGVLRVLYRAGEGTARHSERVHRELRPSTAGAARFRVERTTVAHLQIARRYGWRLLADPGADLPDVTAVPGPRPVAGPVQEFENGARRPRCPDVVVAPADRPKLLVRGSVHAAVRNAQVRLNAFHRYRVAVGQSGLKDAPLTEDCVFGEHTFRAVRSFQELAFPGVPAEHDGRIGGRTWTQLDAITLGPGPVPVARPSVETVALTDDAFAPIVWDRVVGLDTTAIAVELVATGLPAATLPDRIGITLVTRPANRAAGSGTVASPVAWDVPRSGPDPAAPHRMRYRISRPVADLGPMLAVEKRVKEVATVVRSGGTSDATVRSVLGWVPRGRATQPTTVTGSTGSAATETPDARTLFRAGGVEVLEVRLAPRPHWQVPAAAVRLLRSPADVFYYSGHGLSSSGKLAVDTGPGPASCPASGPFADWLGPADLVPHWRSPMDLDVLVIAGCSVLRIDPSTSPPTGPGVAWTALLVARGGPLAALLGYRSSAPCDTPNGDRIAAAFTRRLAGGSSRFAHDWLTANGDHNADNAVAIDARGYWWIDSGVLGGYTIKGPAPLR